MSTRKIAILGGGRIGEALLSGLLSSGWRDPSEVVVTTHPVPMRILGFPGVFAPTGSAAFLLDHFGLNAAGIRDAALELLEARGEAAPVAQRMAK